MLIRVIDFESTGFPPECAIVEIGWCDVTFVDCNNITIGAPQSRLCNPGQRIPPEARAIHHISDFDIKDSLTWPVTITGENQATPGKPYPNTTEAGFMKVNDNADSQRGAE